MPSLASRFALVIACATASLAAPIVSQGAQSTQTPAERNFNQGETYFKANNWTAAIPYYKAAIAADPSFAAAYYSLGLAYYQNKDPKDAANAFRLYLKYKPNDVPGLMLLGISLKDAGENNGAIETLHTVINLKPEAKYLNSAYYNMGVAYENAHQLPEAMQTYIVLRTISPDDAQDLLDYMRSVDPDLKAADATPAPSAAKPASPPTPSKAPSKSTSGQSGASSAPPASAKPAAPSQATAAIPSGTAPSALPDLPDLPAARTAIQAATMIHADDLTLTDVIFILQFRDASTSNQAAAKKVWSEVLDKEKDGEPLQISNAVVISSTKTTVELALSDDFKHAKAADTHLILAKPMSAPARAGLVTNISGVITSYKTNPFVLTIERGALLSASSAASTTPSPAASTHTTKPSAAPTAPSTNSSAPKATAPGENWFTYKNAEGNFSANLPIEPKDTVNSVPDAQIATSHTILSLSNDIGYMVVYAETAAEHSVDDASFNSYRDAFLKTLPSCSVAVESEASPSIRGYIGHAYRLNCMINGVKMTMVGDLYWGRRYGYAVLAMFNTAVSDPAEVRRFVDSFKVIDPSK